MERVINKNYRIFYRNLNVDINGCKLLILRKNNVLNINPTLRNSKYAFLFPFSIFWNYFAYKTSDIKINEALVLCIPRYIASGVKHNYWNYLLQPLSCLLMSLPYKVKRGVIHTICLITDSKMEYYENFLEN